MMAPFKVFAILTTFSSAVVEAGVFHLPIARTTAEFEWRFPDPFSHLLVSHTVLRDCVEVAITLHFSDRASGNALRRQIQQSNRRIQLYLS
jgi:hypothetical protein